MAQIIDVIIPVYNNEEGLIRCLNSLDNQVLDRSLFKVVIVDDGSNPQLKPELWSRFDLNINFKRHKKNRGLPAALNTALDISNSRYFVRIDSDDYVHEMFLSCLLLAFTCDNSTFAAAADYKMVDEFENHIANVSSQENPIGCGIMFKRIVLKKIGMYNEEYLLAEEVEFMHRFTQYYKMKRIEIPLYRYTQRANSLTSDKAAYAKYKAKVGEDNNHV
jgi:glycosyltransferase involved in cell wall biosynthesis